VSARAARLLALLAVPVAAWAQAPRERGEAPASETPVEAPGVPPGAAGEVIVVEERVASPDPAQTRLSTDRAVRIPGTQGDALRALQYLPGAAPPRLGRGELVLWGAAPAESRVYLDGVELPWLYHLGGLRSVLPAQVLSGFELHAGAPDARYGRGTGGVVEIATRTPSDRRFSASAGLDPMDAAVAVGVAPGPGVRLLAAVRRAHLAEVAAPWLSAETAALVPVPRYEDGLVRADVDLRGGRQLSLVAIGSTERFSRGVAAADPAEVEREALERGFVRLYARYRLPTRADDLVLTPWLGVSREDRRLVFGAVPAQLQVRRHGAGLRVRHGIHLGPAVRLDSGFDGLLEVARAARAGSLTLPGREGDPAIFGQPPAAEVAADRWRVYTVDAAPHAALAWHRGHLQVQLGARLAALLVAPDRRTPRIGETPAVGGASLTVLPEPRLSLLWEPDLRWSVAARAGLYHQAPAAEDQSAVFGNPLLGPSRGRQASLALRMQLAADASLDLLGFWGQQDRLAVRSPAVPPALAAALVNQGRGRVLGAQLGARLRWSERGDGWLGYTLGRSQRDTGAGLRPSDFDRRHVLNAAASQAFGRFSAGARLHWASGRPYTPVVAAVENTRDARFEPVLGPVNAARLPASLQLDLRLERQLAWRHGAVRLYLELQNALDRANPEEIVYDHDYSEHDYITGLPTLLFAGLLVDM
jgi:hypothetical protein